VLNSEIYEPIFASAITGSMVDEITSAPIQSIQIPVPKNPDDNTPKEIGRKIKMQKENELNPIAQYKRHRRICKNFLLRRRY
jgi:hypothetical protein